MYDILIVGGGINGCGIARDAAGRGLSVLLAERDDLASATSSASTKLVHGGLRYLEQFEFRLVREALAEREVLWAMAPHIIRPLRFILPHHKGLRSRPLIRLGLFLYDHLGGRKKLPASHTLDLTRPGLAGILKPEFRRGFEYSDCWVDDARLVVLNAMDAKSRGATIQVGTEVVAARREHDHWVVDLVAHETGQRSSVTARVLVNAAGPWVGDVRAFAGSTPARARVRLVKGSHIVIPRIYDHDYAYIFQHGDGRIIFLIPYETDFTLIGTTDVEISGKPEAISVSDQEVDYLCRAANDYVRQAIRPEDVVWSYAGVRPLYDDGDNAAQNVTRDYVLELDGPENEPPLLSVYGGKITTYRHLAEEVLAKLTPWVTGTEPWTRASTLPGGDFEPDAFDALVTRHMGLAPEIPAPLLHRLTRAYGTRAIDVIGQGAAPADLGRSFGADLYEREVRYLLDSEWARTANDILWRRSKLGLRLTGDERRALDDWLNAERKHEG